MDEMSDSTGNPAIIQIFGATPEALIKYVDFVSNISDAPFLIDSTASEARIAGSEYVTETGLSERTIYNSINMSIDDEEIEALTNSDITSSIILGFNPTKPGSDGKIDLQETGSGILEKGLLNISEDCGIIKPLMDVAVTPLGQGGGIAIRTTLKVKSKWGYPAGSGVHNVPSAWEWIKGYKKENPEVWPVCDVGANIVQQMVGGDFVLFGPIENTKNAFTACAMTDMFIAEANEELNITAVDSHPYNILL